MVGVQVHADAAAHNMALKASCRMQDWKRAEGILSDMRAQGITAAPSTYAAILSMCNGAQHSSLGSSRVRHLVGLSLVSCGEE